MKIRRKRRRKLKQRKENLNYRMFYLNYNLFLFLHNLIYYFNSKQTNNRIKKLINKKLINI